MVGVLAWVSRWLHEFSGYLVLKSAEGEKTDLDLSVLPISIDDNFIYPFVPTGNLVVAIRLEPDIPFSFCCSLLCLPWRRRNTNWKFRALVKTAIVSLLRYCNRKLKVILASEKILEWRRFITSVVLQFQITAVNFIHTHELQKTFDSKRSRVPWALFFISLS